MAIALRLRLKEGLLPKNGQSSRDMTILTPAEVAQRVNYQLGWGTHSVQWASYSEDFMDYDVHSMPVLMTTLRFVASDVVVGDINSLWVASGSAKTRDQLKQNVLSALKNNSMQYMNRVCKASVANSSEDIILKMMGFHDRIVDFKGQQLFQHSQSMEEQRIVKELNNAYGDNKNHVQPKQLMDTINKETNGQIMFNRFRRNLANKRIRGESQNNDVKIPILMDIASPVKNNAAYNSISASKRFKSASSSSQH
jgi:hypothetical protein